MRLVKFAFRWGFVKRIRDPNQKCPSKSERSLFVPFFFVCVDIKIITASLLLEKAVFPPEPAGHSKGSTHPTEQQRTKHKEKNAKCALYRSLSLNCQMAGWQVISSSRRDTKAILVEELSNVLTRQQTPSRSPLDLNWRMFWFWPICEPAAQYRGVPSGPADVISWETTTAMSKGFIFCFINEITRPHEKRILTKTPYSVYFVLRQTF